MLKHKSSRIALRAWASAMACLLVSVLAVAAPAPSRGDQLANEGNYAAALQAFAAAQKQSPRIAAIVAKLARVHLQLGENEQAVEWAEQATSLESDNAAYWLLLGDANAAHVNDVSIFSKWGLAHDIRDAYRKGVQVAPDNTKAHSRLAAYYLMAPGIAGGSDEKGEEQIKLLAKLDPAKAAIMRARQAMQDEDYQKAEDWLRKAASAAKDSTGYVALAAFLAYRDLPEAALKVYRTATTKYPDEPTAWYQIGRLAAIGKADPQVGITALETYLDMRIDWRDQDAPWCWAHYRLGQIHERAGAVETARDEYQQALKLNPDFPEATQAMQSLPTSGNPVRRLEEQGA